MPVTDGKYCTVAQLRVYGDVPTPAVGMDQIYSDAILRAEAAFERMTGSQFNQQTTPVVQPLNAYVDGSGWMWLNAVEVGPITAVRSVQWRIPSFTTWQTLTWGVDDILLPNAAIIPPDMGWTARIFNQSLPSLTTDQLLVRWSYTGGYAVIPQALSGIIERLAWWYIKLREAPVGTVRNELGTLEVPVDMPKDIAADARLWAKEYV
jgi:hypothetical protein